MQVSFAMREHRCSPARFRSLCYLLPFRGHGHGLRVPPGFPASSSTFRHPPSLLTGFDRASHFPAFCSLPRGSTMGMLRLPATLKGRFGFPSGLLPRSRSLFVLSAEDRLSVALVLLPGCLFLPVIRLPALLFFRGVSLRVSPVLRESFSCPDRALVPTPAGPPHQACYSASVLPLHD